MNQLVQTGFSLVELMLTVAVVGLLAAIALPTYQDYTVRSKVSQLITSFDGVKTCVTAQYITDVDNAGLVSTLCSVAANAYFRSISPAASGFTISQAASVLGVAVSATMTNGFASVSSVFGDLVWTCNGTPSKYFPASCR